VLDALNIIMMKTHYILLFESVHKVMKAEKILRSEGIKHDIIPTPKEFSSDCGMSVRLSIEKTDIEGIKELFSAQNILITIHEK